MHRVAGVLLALAAWSGASGAEADLADLLAAADYDAVVARVTEPGQAHYLAELIERADALGLAESPQWRALLHYRKDWFGGDLSEVDGANFFMSKRGKTRPRDELHATLAAFFSNAFVPPSKHTPQCRFLARYTWLDEQLRFDPARMPPQPCETYDVFYATAEPVGLTVVFPSTHPNSPSSMFGHTLIRIDGKGHEGASRLLDFTVNYAAEFDPGNGVAYALKGLTGGLVGRFNVVPYHMKLREYAQMENRDIWEYHLNVSQRTVDKVLMHAWELLGTHFDYYFFTENCSYHVLTLLEADLYDRHLVDAFDDWVLPTDTLRVLEQRGLVGGVDYYPSSYRTILARRARLAPDEDALAEALYRDGLSAHRATLDALPVERQAAALDMAFDYLRYKKIAADDKLKPELDETEKSLLIARSRLKVASADLAIAPPGIRPDEGHGTARIALGGGYDDNGSYLRLDARGVYHDWLDPADGYSSNFALEFGRLGLRYYTGDSTNDRIKADYLYLINLDNFEPLDRFFRRPSWHVTTGWESVYNDARERDLALMLRGGGGGTVRLGGSGTLLYAGVDASIAYASAYATDFYGAAGPMLAIMRDVGRDWRVKLDGRYLYSLTRDPEDQAAISGSLSYALGRDWAVGGGIAVNRKLDGWMTDAGLWLNHYF